MTQASVGTDVESAKGLPDVQPMPVSPVPEPTHWLDLVWTLVRTEFKVRYHGTIGGFAWALAKPLAMFVLLMGVFSFVFGSDPDYPLNLVIGLFLWDFFAEGTKSGLSSLHARGFLLTRARCPAWILVVTSISNQLITLAVFSVTIMIFLLAVGRPPSVGGVALFAAYVGALVAIVVGFSLGSSVVFLRYRDLNQVWDLVSQAGFFVAPIIIPAWHPARTTASVPVHLAAYTHHRVLPPGTRARCGAYGHRSRAVGARGGGILARWQSRFSPAWTARRRVSVSICKEGHIRMTPAIEVDDVVKSFRVPSVRRDTLREHVLGGFRRRQFDQLRVLDGITFRLNRGEALGIMGRNGCGKSTLLRIICGIYPPDRGRVRVSATLTPILELGVGWNPELDAVDNIYLIGTLMGLSLNQIRQRMDRILAFAELERFANLRLKHYSSGMSSRLGYAVAFEAVRDVLVLDEIFAVGDAGFKRRCEDRYRKLRARGQTVLLVGHDPSIMARFCDRALLLEGGRIVMDGPASQVAEQYLSVVNVPHAPQSHPHAVSAS